MAILKQDVILPPTFCDLNSKLKKILNIIVKSIEVHFSFSSRLYENSNLVILI